MGYKLLFFIIMLLCFLTYSHSHIHLEDGLSNHHLRHPINSLHPHSASQDFVSNGRQMLEEGRRTLLWMDVQALLSFKKHIKHPSRKLSNWTTGNWEEACSWYGITCRHQNPRVVAIILPGLSLTGTLSPSIGSLSLLHTLNLSQHNLSGEIPLEFGQLKALRVLDLSFNYMLFSPMLTGPIPTSLSNCTSLERLALSRNNFTGSIPTEFSHLVNLEQLDLSDNFLSGHIPPILSNCTKLAALSLTLNWFTGSIPTEFGRLVKLELLDLSGNSLSGHIPPTLGNCTKLSTLSLTLNNFTGTIPTEFGRLVELQQLDLEGNSGFGGNLPALEGRIPPTLANCTKLSTLELGYNKFMGSIPIEFGRLVQLEYLRFSSNSLSGRIPPILGNCTKLRTIYFDNNSFTGTIPIEFGRLIELEYLAIQQNSLSGQILPTLGNCTKLQYLDLHDNQLSGKILRSIFNSLTDLHSLDLSRNKLEGPMPTLHNCGSLAELDVSKNMFNGNLDIGFSGSLLYFSGHSNNFSGPLSSSFVHCNILVLLDLWNNRLMGEIPGYFASFHKLQVLSLGYSEFSGGIGQWVTNMTQLYILDLSGNKFSGGIPLDLERLQGYAINISWHNESFMENFIRSTIYFEMEIDIKGRYYNLSSEYLTNTIFDLSNNMFTGEIPTNIGSLSSLRLLNLSWNQLQGKIPSSLGNISTLEQLDLANNNFIGEIPQELSKLSMLEVVNFSSNNLCGSIPRGTQFSTFPVNSFQRNKCLCGYPLTTCKNIKARSMGGVGAKSNVKVGWLHIVEKKMSMIALGIGVIIGIGAVVIVLITWKKAWNWMVAARKLKPFYGVYRFPI